MTDRHPRHPSEKPIRTSKWGVKSIFRIPDDGSVIPRLREQVGARAIGFTARIAPDDDE
jgi:hypothetical protein